MIKVTNIPMSVAIAAALATFPLAATSRASVALNFTFSSAGSSGDVSGGFLTSLTEDISTVTINGTSYSGLTDQLTITSTGAADTFAISGALNGALVGVTGTWLTFETQPSEASVNGAGDFVVTYGNPKSVDSVSSVLAADLGVTFTTGAGALSVLAGNGAIIDTAGQVISDVLSPTLSSTSDGAPEPSSCLLLGAGLLVVFLAVRNTLCLPPASR